MAYSGPCPPWMPCRARPQHRCDNARDPPARGRACMRVGSWYLGCKSVCQLIRYLGRLVDANENAHAHRLVPLSVAIAVIDGI